MMISNGIANGIEMYLMMIERIIIRFIEVWVTDCSFGGVNDLVFYLQSFYFL